MKKETNTALLRAIADGRAAMLRRKEEIETFSLEMQDLLEQLRALLGAPLADAATQIVVVSEDDTVRPEPNKKEN